MRIRKKEPSVGVLGKIINSFSSSKQDTYSADYINKIPMKELENNTNIDNIRENGNFVIFNAKGVLPKSYSADDNNIFIDSYLFGTDYGRQILHDVRTNKSFSRNLSNGVWQEWSSNDYSTEETFTGKYWIDGKKIYRKVINSGACSLGTENVAFDSELTNISNIIDINFMYKFNVIWYKLWNIQEIGYSLAEDKVYVSTTINADFDDSFIILEYTKTTE